MNTTTNKSYSTIVTTFYYLNAGSTNLDNFIDYLKESPAIENYKDFFNLLFQEDNYGNTLLNYITRENKAVNLFVEILNEYEKEFILVPPKKWKFIFTHNKNDCHKALVDFYGQKYFEAIFNPDNSNISMYSNDYLLDYYLSDKLTDSLTIENLKRLPDLKPFEEHMIYVLIFLNEDKEGFKKFILDSARNEEKQKSSNGLLFSKLLYKENIQFFKTSGGSTTLTELKLNLPTEIDLKLLIDNLGISKTSEVISEYLNLQKEYILQNKIQYTDIKFDKKRLEALMHSDIKFIDCGQIFALALKNEPEILSYLLLTDVIKKEHLWCNLKNENLKVRANHYNLQNTLETNAESRKKLKI